MEDVYLRLRNLHKAHEFLGMKRLPIFMCDNVIKDPQVEQYIADYKKHLDHFVKNREFDRPLTIDGMAL